MYFYCEAVFFFRLEKSQDLVPWKWWLYRLLIYLKDLSHPGPKKIPLARLPTNVKWISNTMRNCRLAKPVGLCHHLIALFFIFTTTPKVINQFNAEMMKINLFTDKDEGELYTARRATQECVHIFPATQLKEIIETGKTKTILKTAILCPWSCSIQWRRKKSKRKPGACQGFLSSKRTRRNV